MLSAPLCDPLQNHKYLLIKLIIKLYLDNKLKYTGAVNTMEFQTKRIRNMYSKLIIFQGQ